LDRGEKVIVGVNKYASQDERRLPILRVDEEVDGSQKERLKGIKRKRNNDAVRRHLQAVAEAAREGKSLMPFIIDAVREYATIGEISNVFREVYGVYRDPGYF
jgi:methylmalonyl-CoA mutase N-terminal domain/subunit